MEEFIATRAALGYSATTDAIYNEKRVTPGSGILPNKQIWTDAKYIPAVLHDTLTRQVDGIQEVDPSGDGLMFGIDGHPASAGVVAKRVRKPLRAVGSIQSHGYTSYAWDTAHGPAIPGSAGEGFATLVEYLRSDDRLEVLADAFVTVDIRLHGGVFVKTEISGELYATFYAYVGRYGLLEEAGELQASSLELSPRDHFGPTYGDHEGPSVGIHRGDVIGNLKGYVESLDNHRFLTATLLGELHGHADGTFQGEATGSFVGSAVIDGGEMGRIESLAVGMPVSSHAPVSIMSNEDDNHIHFVNEDAHGNVRLTKEGQLHLDCTFAASSANIDGHLRASTVECNSLRALLGIRNSYAGIREAGVLSGVSDASVESGLYFGENRFAPTDGSFRIIREASPIDHSLELVVQAAVDGEWTTIRPVGSLGATAVGTPKEIQTGPGPGPELRIARSQNKRNVMLEGEQLGNIELEFAFDGEASFLAARLGLRTFDRNNDGLESLANVVVFSHEDPSQEVMLFVDMYATSQHKALRGSLRLRKGLPLIYGSVPYGNLDLVQMTTSSAVAFVENSFTIRMADAPRHLRQAIRLGLPADYAPDDSFFEYQEERAAWIGKSGRGPCDIVIKPTKYGHLAEPVVRPSTVLTFNHAPVHVDIADALVGSTAIVTIDGVELFQKPITQTRQAFSIGTLFASFRKGPRYVRVDVKPPAAHLALPGLCEFEVRNGLFVLTFSNGVQNWSQLLPYMWSEVPHSSSSHTDAIAFFADSVTHNSQEIHVPLDLLATHGNVEVDNVGIDNGFSNDTASYRFDTRGRFRVLTYMFKRGSCRVRIRTTTTNTNA